jgi:hypothetical protein
MLRLTGVGWMKGVGAELGSCHTATKSPSEPPSRLSAASPQAPGPPSNQL